MVKPQSKKLRKRGTSSSHQINWLWGQQLVIDTIEANRWQVYELFVTAEVSHRYKNLLKSQNAERIEIEIVSESRLEELSKTSEHEGIVARVSKYPYQPFENLAQLLQSVRAPLDSDSESVTASDLNEENTNIGSVRLVDSTTSIELKSRQPLVVLIDRIQDAFVFASVLRCCENAGVLGVIVGEFCQAQVTTQIARTTHGAVNHMPIFRTESLVDAAKSLRDLGFQLVTVDGQGAQSICETPLRLATAILVSSDTVGLDPTLQSLCDHVVSVPAFGKSTSLPPSVNAGILLYEIRRQQRAVP